MGFIRGIGPMELLLILAIVLIIFGPGKLPEAGAALGRALREFRRGVKGEIEEKEAGEEETPPQGS